VSNENGRAIEEEESSWGKKRGKREGEALPVRVK